jgi:hypothetical protein
MASNALWNFLSKGATAIKKTNEDPAGALFSSVGKIGDKIGLFDNGEQKGKRFGKGLMDSLGPLGAEYNAALKLPRLMSEYAPLSAMAVGPKIAKPAIIHKPEINVKKIGDDSLQIEETRGENLIKYALGRYYLGRGTDPVSYTSAAMSFAPKSGMMPYGAPIGWNAGLSRLNGVKDSVYEMLPKLNPDSFGYTAGARVLNPLYDRMTQRLAKDFGGKPQIEDFSDHGGLKSYTINFPNRPPEGSDPALNELLHKFFRPKGGF